MLSLSFPFFLGGRLAQKDLLFLGGRGCPKKLVGGILPKRLEPRFPFVPRKFLGLDPGSERLLMVSKLMVALVPEQLGPPVERLESGYQLVFFCSLFY